MDGGTLSVPLFLVFLVLKLTHVIAWSWLWVTSPLWIDVAGTLVLVFFVLVMAGGISGAAAIVKRRKDKRFEKRLDRLRSKSRHPGGRNPYGW